MMLVPVMLMLAAALLMNVSLTAGIFLGIAAAYGNDRIVIAIDADGIGYECMDERSIR